MTGNNFESNDGLYELIRHFDSDDMRLIFSRVDTLTMLNIFKICDDNTKKILFSYIDEYEMMDFTKHLDRLAKHIPIEDCIKARNIICDIIRQYDPTKKNSSIKNISFIPDNLVGYQLYEIIPKNISLDYNTFISAYYEILWLLYMCFDAAKKCGLLQIESIPFYLKADDYIRKGLMFVTDGAWFDELSPILSNYIKNEYSFYKKVLKQIATKGILGIVCNNSFRNTDDSFRNADEFIISLIEDSGIKDNITLNVCKEYKNGNTKAFEELFQKDSALYNQINTVIEREEITFVRKVLEFYNKIRREGLDTIKEDLDKELVFKKDIFEYGLYLVLGNVDVIEIKKILESIIDKMTNVINREFYLAQIDAVLCIQQGYNMRLLLASMLSHFEDDISTLAWETFKEYFE
jgi:flagellar motor component MotA